MSITTIVTFIRVRDSSGTVQDRYQNGKRDDFNPLDKSTDRSGEYNTASSNGLVLDGEIYWFLPFLYQGAAKNRSGDNLEAALVFANNPLAMNRAIQAVQSKWTIEVTVCKVDPTTLAVQRKLTTETWLAASMSYDPTTIEVLLSSGIDAVGSNAPGRVLTSQLCGHLPTTGQIRNA